jgi:hypothetical protein
LFNGVAVRGPVAVGSLADIVFVTERAQLRPAYPHEKRALLDSLTSGERQAGPT